MKKFIIIFFLIFTVSPSILLFAQEEIFRREASLKSELFDGPYIIYEGEKALVINSIEDNNEMKLILDDAIVTELQSVNVYKSGFMPRKFNVDIRKQHVIEPFKYPFPDKIFALSDIEGNFNTCVNLLQQHNVLDQNLSWVYGEGHLVIIGDIFDRGNHQTELLWLFYKLEKEAKTAGGYLHLILGNHEVMNLKGDLRYVNEKYSILDSLARKEIGINYTDLIGENSELGRWLRSKNSIELIGNMIFVHAGLSPKLMESNLSIDEINNVVRINLDKDNKEYNNVDSLIMKGNGPLWYRGYFRSADFESSSEADVKNILDHFGAVNIVVGHTRFKKPAKFFDGSVIGINVNPPQDHNFIIPPRQCFGIIIEDGKFFIADDNGYIREL